MKQAAMIMCLPMAVLSIAGCTPKPTARTFSQSEANTVMSVEFGTVIALREVEIRPGQTRLGAIVGAALGAVGGSQIGSSTAANVAGGIGGAVAGGAVGSAIQGANRTRGVEFTLRLASGETVAVVQPGAINDYRVGDRVRLVGSAENARVTR